VLISAPQKFSGVPLWPSQGTQVEGVGVGVLQVVKVDVEVVTVVVVVVAVTEVVEDVTLKQLQAEVTRLAG